MICPFGLTWHRPELSRSSISQRQKGKFGVYACDAASANAARSARVADGAVAVYQLRRPRQPRDGGPRVAGSAASVGDSARHAVLGVLYYLCFWYGARRLARGPLRRQARTRRRGSDLVDRDSVDGICQRLHLTAAAQAAAWFG